MNALEVVFKIIIATVNNISAARNNNVGAFVGPISKRLYQAKD